MSDDALLSSAAGIPIGHEAPACLVLTTIFRAWEGFMNFPANFTPGRLIQVSTMYLQKSQRFADPMKVPIPPSLRDFTILAALSKRFFIPRRGFALVVSLSLMVLLAILAVGLMSLSAIALRQSGTGMAVAEARANARIALMLALGDLQKSLGPDQAVSAPANLLAATSKMPLTGAWQSWAPKPDESQPDYQAEKDERFLQWLVSDSRPDEVAKPEYPQKAPVDALTLASGDSSGNGKILAGRVKIGSRGGYAWHVSDEAAKARIDLARDPAPGNDLGEQRALLAGHRPAGASPARVGQVTRTELRPRH